MKMMIYWSRYNWSSSFSDSTINTQQRRVVKSLISWPK